MTSAISENSDPKRKAQSFLTFSKTASRTPQRRFSEGASAPSMDRKSTILNARRMTFGPVEIAKDSDLKNKYLSDFYKLQRETHKQKFHPSAKDSLRSHLFTFNSPSANLLSLVEKEEGKQRLMKKRPKEALLLAQKEEQVRFGAHTTNFKQIKKNVFR